MVIENNNNAAYFMALCPQIEDSFAKITNYNLSFKFMRLRSFDLFASIRIPFGDQIELNKFSTLIPSV